ncbi:unnamed protein product, partial [Gordionus sp. m RMFG-2023]
MDRRVETVLGWDWIKRVGPAYDFWGVFAKWCVFVPIDSENREVIIKTVMDEWEEIEPEGMAEWREGRDNIEMDDGDSLYWGEREGITVKDSIDAVREYHMLGEMEGGRLTMREEEVIQPVRGVGNGELPCEEIKEQ